MSKVRFGVACSGRTCARRPNPHAKCCPACPNAADDTLYWVLRTPKDGSAGDVRYFRQGGEMPYEQKKATQYSSKENASKSEMARSLGLRPVRVVKRRERKTYTIGFNLLLAEGDHNPQALTLGATVFAPSYAHAVTHVARRLEKLFGGKA